MNIQITEARRAYAEVDWRLSFLRAVPSSPQPDPTDEQIMKWYTQGPVSIMYKLRDKGEVGPGTTCNEWFSAKFPDQVKQFGPAFFEARQSSVEGYSRTTPASLNYDVCAAVLSDARLGLSTVYFGPEMQFYYFEPMLQLYKTTTPEKLQNYYRAMILRCAQELNNDTNKLNLFAEFRSDKVSKAVVNRAKSILAADSSFFSSTSPHQRIRGIEMHERLARKFVDELLTCESGQVLMLHDAYTAFCKLLKQRELEPIKRNDFKAIVVPLIRDEFDVALRNDLVVDERQGVRGWKNVRLSQTVPA